MPDAVVSLTIKEADIVRTKEAAMAFTGLPSTATAKELLAATAQRVVTKWEAETHNFIPPGIT